MGIINRKYMDRGIGRTRIDPDSGEVLIFNGVRWVGYDPEDWENRDPEAEYEAAMDAKYHAMREGD